MNARIGKHEIESSDQFALKNKEFNDTFKKKTGRSVRGAMMLGLTVWIVTAGIGCAAPLQTNSSKVAAGPTNSPPQTTVAASDGQELFLSHCASCHHSGTVSTAKNQSQLISFIPNHHTGAGLTQQEVAAIASFLKP